jgi:hypothetical protein
MTKKGKKRASADVGLMFVEYNLRRIINILDKNIFKKLLRELYFLFFRNIAFTNINSFSSLIHVFVASKSIRFSWLIKDTLMSLNFYYI